MDGRRSIMLIMNRCRCERSTNQRYEMNRVIRELNLSKDRAINRLEKKRKKRLRRKEKVYIGTIAGIVEEGLKQRETRTCFVSRITWANANFQRNSFEATRSISFHVSLIRRNRRRIYFTMKANDRPSSLEPRIFLDTFNKYLYIKYICTNGKMKENERIFLIFYIFIWSKSQGAWNQVLLPCSKSKNL